MNNRQSDNGSSSSSGQRQGLRVGDDTEVTLRETVVRQRELKLKKGKKGSAVQGGEGAEASNSWSLPGATFTNCSVTILNSVCVYGGSPVFISNSDDITKLASAARENNARHEAKFGPVGVTPSSSGGGERGQRDPIIATDVPLNIDRAVAVEASNSQTVTITEEEDEISGSSTYQSAEESLSSD